MAASPSTTTSIPPTRVSKLPAPQKGSQTARTPWPESDVLVCCSCRLTLIVFQQAAQPLPTSHLFLFSTDCLSWQLRQAFLPNRPYPAFRIGVQIRTSGRQGKGSSRFLHRSPDETMSSICGRD